MEPVERVDSAALERRAAQAVHDGDVGGLNVLVAEVDALRQQYAARAVEEDRLAREAEKELASAEAKLAFMSEEDARRTHAELFFRPTLHRQRVKACEAEFHRLEALVKDLRRQRDEVHAKTLEARWAAEARRLSTELQERKVAIAPLLEAVEHIYRLVREVELHNQTHRSAPVPLPVLHGDVAAAGRLGAVRLELPPEWQPGRDHQRRGGDGQLTDRELLAAHGFGEE